jgi:hypothetical protein
MTPKVPWIPKCITTDFYFRRVDKIAQLLNIQSTARPFDDVN